MSKTTAGLVCANGIALILGIAMTGQLLREEPQTDFPETNKSNPTLPVLTSIENRSLIEAPLFQPSRKPILVPSIPVAPIAMPEPIPPPVLVGIIKTGKERMVLLEDRQNNTSGLVREGESFGEWQIRAINEKSVVIGHTQDENLTMSLHPENLSPFSAEGAFE